MAPRGNLADLLGAGDGADSEEEAAEPMDDYGEEFAEEIVEAFPDLKGKPERIDALKRAIHACMREGNE